MGSDANTVLRAVKLKISIHAPVWGATFSRCVFVIDFPISIHAPVWGATTIDKG